jgi:hypothetical protein
LKSDTGEASLALIKAQRRAGQPNHRDDEEGYCSLEGGRLVHRSDALLGEADAGCCGIIFSGAAG